jgi:hypothetical protein
VDFTSRPTRRKAITLAEGWREGRVVHLQRLRRLGSLQEWVATLHEPGPWLGGFDLPFGLPRELVLTLGWPTEWASLMRHYAGLERAQIREQFAAFCAARPAGGKFAHRACDGPAGSSPSMKWVNPPVAYMLHAGLPCLLEAGCDLPGLHAGDAQRRALEAYPGLLARELIGRRSYKSDDPAAQTPERHAARAALVQQLTTTGSARLGLTLAVDTAQRDLLVDDASADTLDAVLCLVQAAWASDQPRHGWPETVDPLEGWILSA